MTADSIQRIIESCAQANVREIDLPGLRLEFGERGPAKTPPAPPKSQESTRPTEGALSEEEHAKQNQEALELDEARLKQDRLELMWIENPLEAERLLANGDLEDLGAEGEDDGGDEG